MLTASALSTSKLTLQISREPRRSACAGVYFLPQLPQMTAMSIQDAAADIREEFSWLEDWEARYAHIIDLGKNNPPLEASERTEETRVRGCASQVWMVTSVRDDEITVRAESDAMIVSGLIALLVRLYSGASLKEAASFDAETFLDEIGVKGALTAQRSNGLASMLARIRRDAGAALAG